MKKIMIPALLLLLLIPLVSADYLYPNYADGILGSGIFNSGMDTGEVVISAFRSVDSPALLPLISDLNDDGVEEIIVIDGDKVEVYQGTTLVISGGEDAEDTIEHVILYDIDDDGYKEILTVGGDKFSIFDFGCETHTYQENGSSYTHNGTIINIGNITDNDWNTYGHDLMDGNTSYMWINYTTPLSATRAEWEIYNKDGARTNITIPSGCFGSTLQLQLIIHNEATKFGRWSCYDGSSWMLLAEYTTANSGLIFEEAMNYYHQGESCDNKLVLTANYTIDPCTGEDRDEHMIGCGAVEECMVITACVEDGVPSVQDLKAQKVNSTGVYLNSTLFTGVTNSDWYLPKIRVIEIADIDEDGNDEYVFTTWGYNNANMYLISAGFNTTHVYVKDHVSISTQVLVDSGRDDFTSPTIYNFDPSSNGLEIAVAYQADSANEFRMSLYDEDLDLIDNYPELLGIPYYEEGVLISNVIRTNVFPSSGAVDMCVMGYDTVGNEINLLCGSEQASWSIDNNEVFNYDGSVYYDLIDNETLYSNIIHAVDMELKTTDGTDLDEILTPMGVFSIDYEGDNELLLEYDIGLSQGAALAYDLEGVDQVDILYLNSDGLRYINDGFTNTNVQIDGTIQRHDSPLCLNDFFPIYVDVVDVNGDTGNCELLSYNGDGTLNASEYNSSFVGTTENLGLFYNADSQGTFRMVLRCNDTEHITYDTEEWMWAVTNNTDICFDSTDPMITIIVEPDPDETEKAQDTLALASVDDFFDDIGMEGSIIRNLLSMLIIALIAFGAFKATNGSMELTGGAAFLGALACFLFQLMSILPFIMILFVMIYLMIRMVVANRQPGG